MLSERDGSGSFLQSEYNLALILSLILSFIAVVGTVGGAWYMSGAVTPISNKWIIFFAASGGSMVVFALITILLWSRFRSRLSQRISWLAQICQEVTNGQTQRRIPLSGNDEFTLLSNNINNILDMREGNGAPMTDAVALQNQIEKLLQEISSVGEGDLSVQAEVTPDTLGVLADSFNYMIEELAKVVSRVQTTTQQVISVTNLIRQRSLDLARGSDLQRQEITSASEQVEELAAFIIEASRNAILSSNAAQEALASARDGREAVSQTISGMRNIRDTVQDTAKKIKRLGERSQEISEIVRVIEDLSEQTNLLALNAAIQSAMAGENGRGFAVVSDEIRLLAERSSDAAKRIVGLVKSIQTETNEAVVAMESCTTEVVNGSRTADEAGRALESILGAVDNQARMINDISVAANERTDTSDRVTAAMSHIADITNETTNVMNEAVRSVGMLTDFAEQLRASVSAFRLPPQAASSTSLGLGMQRPNLAPPPTNIRGQLPPGRPPYGNPNQPPVYRDVTGNYPRPNQGQGQPPMNQPPQRPYTPQGTGQFNNYPAPLPQLPQTGQIPGYDQQRQRPTGYPTDSTFNPWEDTQQDEAGQDDTWRTNDRRPPSGS